MTTEGARPSNKKKADAMNAGLKAEGRARALQGMLMLPKMIYVRDEGAGGLLIVGEDGNNISAIDADDGDKLGVYERQDIKVYRVNPRLEPIRKK